MATLLGQKRLQPWLKLVEVIEEENLETFWRPSLQLPRSSLRACGSRSGDHNSLADITLARSPTHKTAFDLQAKIRN